MRYKVFGRRTGLRVSELALGCGMFGRLTADQERRLDEVSAVPLGFPHEMLTRFKDMGQQIADGKADLLDPPAVAVP